MVSSCALAVSSHWNERERELTFRMLPVGDEGLSSEERVQLQFRNGVHVLA